jgi:hypothetical protein
MVNDYHLKSCILDTVDDLFLSVIDCLDTNMRLLALKFTL